jgi:hypothetical protein
MFHVPENAIVVLQTPCVNCFCPGFQITDKHERTLRGEDLRAECGQVFDTRRAAEGRQATVRRVQTVVTREMK